MKRNILINFVFLITLLFCGNVFAVDEIITVPAEQPQGVTLDLKKGEYLVQIAGGAIALSYPINPHYQWLVGVAVGTDVKGFQDDPNLGTVYFDPKPAVYTQAEAEAKALKAVKDHVGGTFLRFTLKENKTVRFWVNDFDYSDNSGMIKLNISSVEQGRLP